MSDGRTPTGPDGQSPTPGQEQSPAQPGQQPAVPQPPQGAPQQPEPGASQQGSAQQGAPQRPYAPPPTQQQPAPQGQAPQQPWAQQRPGSPQSDPRPWWQQSGQNPPPAGPPTQQYPTPTAPTERLGSNPAQHTGAAAQYPGQPASNHGGPGQGAPRTPAPEQRYPVQYAAGPGQQHTGGPAYGAYGQPVPDAAQQQADKAKRRGFAWGTAVTSILIGAAVGVLATLVFSGQFVRPVYTGSAVEDGVQGVLEDEFGLADVRDVACPEEPSAAAGAEFACNFTTGDREFSVQIRVLDSGGQYLVGAVSSGD